MSHVGFNGMVKHLSTVICLFLWRPHHSIGWHSLGCNGISRSSGISHGFTWLHYHFLDENRLPHPLAISFIAAACEQKTILPLQFSERRLSKVPCTCFISYPYAPMCHSGPRLAHEQRWPREKHIARSFSDLAISEVVWQAEQIETSEYQVATTVWHFLFLLWFVIPFWLGARAMRNSSVGLPSCHDIPLFVILEKPVSLPILEALL